MGSVALSVQPEGQGRREPPEIAWGSDIFSRGGRDVKPCCRTRMDYHTPSGNRMSRTSLCTESETDPNKMCPDSRSLQRLDLQSDVKPIDDVRRGLRQRFWQSFDDLVAIRDREAELPLRSS
jgi:hypothetical protein